MGFSTIDKAFDFVRNGASIKQSENSTGLPITRIETIWNSTVDCNRFGYANIEDIGKFEKYLLNEGDILMTHINSHKHLGKCAIYKGTPSQLIHGMNLLNLRPDKNVTYSKYVFFYLNSNYFKRQQARHATSRNSGTPVTLIRSPTQRMGDALNALRP